ncbi:MAG: flagellin [Stappiaceae bacterium]
MPDINLSSAVRQNLLSLQNTADLLSGVQNKLATGLKVNSALDNPSSFFTASGLSSRAGDLSTLLDDMGQGVQTLKAADDGLTSVTDLVESAKAKANQALQTSSQYERKRFTEQYNDLLEQIEDVARDASYKGKNLLGGEGNDLSIIFNEENTSSLTVKSVDYTDTTLEDGLNLAKLAEGKGDSSTASFESGTGFLTLTDGTNPLSINDALSESNQIAEDDTITIGGTAYTVDPDGDGFLADGTTAIAAGTGITTVQDLIDSFESSTGVNAYYDEDTGRFDVSVNANDATIATSGSLDLTDLIGAAGNIDQVEGVAATDLLTDTGKFEIGDTIDISDGNDFELTSIEVTDETTVQDLLDKLNDQKGVEATLSSNGTLTVTSDVDLTINSNNTDEFATGNILSVAAEDSDFATDKKINDVIGRLNQGLEELRSQASEFGTNLSTVEIRQDFTKNLINTLETGAGELTLADTNLEGANLLALQTRQQLSSTSLSFASQADQNVLQLF